MEFGLKGDVQVLPFAVDQTQQQVIHVVCHLCLGLLESGDGGHAVLQGFHAVKTDNGDILSGHSAGIAVISGCSVKYSVNTGQAFEQI